MSGQSSIFPNKVLVRFQGRRCSGAVTGSIPTFYTREVNLNDTFSDYNGFSGTKYFHDRALALYASGGSTPTNKTNLDNLAAQIAKDYYNWNSVSFDEVFSDIISPNIDALTDILEFDYRPDDSGTRRYSAPWNPDPEEMMHNDGAANAACVDSLPGTIVQKTPCFESYGPLAGGTSGAITAPVFKNCLQDGILTQEYVRTESFSCGCAPPNVNFCVKIKGICPDTLTESFPTGLTVKLLKDGVFVQNGSPTTDPGGGNFRYCYNSIPSGTGYSIRIEDTFPNWRELTSPVFEVTSPTTPTNTYNIYHWLGWSSLSVHVGYVNGFTDYQGVTVTMIQNGVTTTLITDSAGNVNFGSLLAYDPVTLIPYPIHFDFVPPSSRINNRSIDYTWSDVVNKCTVTSEDLPNPLGSNPSVFDPWGCTHQGDTKGPYVGAGSAFDASCREPLSKTLICEDSVYGSVTLNYVGCPSIGPEWQGTLSVNPPACVVPRNCNAGVENITCPSNPVTLHYIFRTNDPNHLQVRWFVKTQDCPSGGPASAAIFCANDAGAPTDIGASITEQFPPGRSFCGVTLFLVFTTPSIFNRCPNNVFDAGNTAQMYPSGATFTVTEA